MSRSAGSGSPNDDGSEGERTSAPAIIREGLRRAILNGEYASGVQLRQDELAVRFGTSRIPVREALRQLEAEGLVTIEANRGARVKTLSLEEVCELLDIRVMLEGPALRWSIPNMVEDDYEGAAEILRAYEATVDPSGWGDLNWQFHLALYAPCARPRLLAMIGSNYGHVDRFTRVNVSLAAGKDTPLREHWDLLGLCKAGEVAKAVSLLEDHIKHSQKALVAAARRGTAKRNTPFRAKG